MFLEVLRGVNKLSYNTHIMNCQSIKKKVEI